MKNIYCTLTVTLIRYICIVLPICLVLGCVKGLPNHDVTNTWEIYRLLAYYKYVECDTLKYAAAKYLVDNMSYHNSDVRICKDNDTLARWKYETDSIYYSIVQGCVMKDFPWDTLRHVKKMHRTFVEADTLPDVIVDNRMMNDLKELTFNFLREHIDNAFYVWRKSPFAKKLTFDEFKEYILPYRCIEGYGFNETGKTYHDLFAKYVMSDKTANLRTTIHYYNATLNNLRDMNGKTHRTQIAGIYDLFSRDFHDCIDIANYGCNILRACGLPVVVEYNICYRSLPGCHYHCSVYNDSIGTWQTFNAESSLPGDGDWAFAETANVYRTTYAAQKDTPPFLKADGEYVPEILNCPCIKDVTSYLTSTTSITLPFKEQTENNLAYLATFHKNNEGLIPVTWGLIDKKNATVTFENAMPCILYFPIYYSENEHKVFGDPFFIEMTDSMAVIKKLPYSEHTKSTYNTVMLTRKYPRKPNMIRVAEELVGGRFIGSAKGDFSDAVTLLEIKCPPIPALLTYPLNRTGCYKSYRFQASEEHPYAHISMLEWLTSSKYGYKNTMPALHPHILSSADTVLLAQESRLVRLMDAVCWEKMSWKAEYDGNMQTAPSAYPNITLRLKEPQKVTHVRFSPKNADNGIRAGDVYELHYWNKGWHSCGMVKAKYEYVDFNNIPQECLYWLENKTQGKEEMPFVLDKENKQLFIYYDIIKYS